MFGTVRGEKIGKGWKRSMFYICVEDFYKKAQEVKRLTREEEKLCASAMKAGEQDARTQLMESYYPMVSAALKRLPKELQTIKSLYSALKSLEQGIDNFNFHQDSEPFPHHLSWRLRQAITKCIADR